ncbi:hypothetical protein DW355_13390 [Hylemonella gracilis]|uniref:Uncharacterized protein n=1 Tax=Hylemonella gracilis TaxID=80880 RepID=A0A4P6UKH0_9BURK|nr:hypothetical protein [Hylemonella gracilis]QBK05593.1 hypothetical protein DW355_13390 [Hylemonella gracilis]
MRPFFVFFPLRVTGQDVGVIATGLAALLLCIGAAQAQTSAPVPVPMPYDAEHDRQERTRIKHEREQAAAVYKEAQVDCYQRFAVNACLKDARRARRVVADRLRGEEIVLDDAKRTAEVESQKQRVEARQAERARQEAAREQQEAARAGGRTPPRGNAPAPAGR